jgi:hypothetical protein
MKAYDLGLMTYPYCPTGSKACVSEVQKVLCCAGRGDITSLPDSQVL